MITGEQAKAARALLNWSQMTLAQSAEYGVTFVNHFENERSALSPEARVAIRRALEEAGVEFPEGAPPRLNRGAVMSANWWDASQRHDVSNDE